MTAPHDCKQADRISTLESGRCSVENRIIELEKAEARNEVYVREMAQDISEIKQIAYQALQDNAKTLSKIDPFYADLLKEGLKLLGWTILIIATLTKSDHLIKLLGGN